MKTKFQKHSLIISIICFTLACYLLAWAFDTQRRTLFAIAFLGLAIISACATAIIVVALGLTSLMDQADARARARSTHTLPLRPTVSYSENPSSRHDRSTSDPAALNVGATETVRAQPLFPLSPAPLRPGLSRFNSSVLILIL
jgi:hypothetical protein